MKTIRRVPVETAGVIGFALFALLLTMLVGNTLAQGSSGDSRHYTAIFTDASGVKPGDDVRIAGVRVGRVDSRELIGNLAHVGFTVANDQHVRADTEVKVSYLNLLGQRYLALEAGASAANRLPDTQSSRLTTPPPRSISRPCSTPSSHCSMRSSRPTSTHWRPTSSRSCKARVAQSAI